MTIRVVYDITLLGKFFSYSDANVGIYRVTEKLLLHLLKMENIDLTLTHLCSENPAFSSINCPLYIQEYLSSYSCQFMPSFKSKLRLEWFYQALCSTYFSKDFQKLPKYSLNSFLVRGLIKLLNLSQILHYDNYQFFEPQNYNLLHSTFDKLPPEELTLGIPRLLTIYDLIPVKYQDFVNPLLTIYFQKILNSINLKKDWVVCISEYTRQEFCEYTGMSPERTFVTYLGADERFYPVVDYAKIAQIKQTYKIPETSYFLCLASQLEPRKNIPHLIQSFVSLIVEHSHLDINLVLIGTTRHKREEISKILQENKEYQSRIIFTGYVSDEDLSTLYSGATAFIFPSLYEGFGLPILEAMQCGIPVISSNATSLPEVAGDAAILVDPQDRDALSQAMLNILTNSNLREELYHKGLERSRTFSWAKCAAETVDIYQKIINY